MMKPDPLPGRSTTESEASLVVTGGRVVTSRGVATGDLVIEQGRIVGVFNPAVDRLGTVVDADDAWVCPAFIDLQINGGFGCDFTTDPETIWEVGALLPATGVAAFLPTIVTSSEETIQTAREVIASGPPDGYVGAVPLGLHLEGPFLADSQRGAHDQRGLRVPNADVIEEWSPANHVVLVTLAAELSGADALVESLSRRGVVVALGHSNATYEQAVDAIERGARFGTHLFNAMSGFHHREPGLVGALLTAPDVTVGVIVDGAHLHPGAVELAWNAKKPHGLVLVSDAMAAMGMGHGSFDLGSVRVTVDGTGPRTVVGNLAGSTLTLDQAVRNFVSTTGCSVVEAANVSSTNPARVIGDADRGGLGVGMRGDVVLIDSDFNVELTVVGGRVTFSNRSRGADSFEAIGEGP